MSSNKVLHPEVLWAQRSNELFITINVIDCKEPKINVTGDKLSFEGKAGPEQLLYGFELDFYKEIKPETAKRSTTARNIFLVLEKAEQKQGYWPRLQKDKTKIPFIKTDFARWKDEDDDEDEGGPDPMGGMDFSSLMGEGADSALDDSDEDMPGLETVDDATNINDSTKEESTETSEDIKSEDNEIKKDESESTK
ncbi:HSP20-like chaperone [Glomus cerebriforme]|uniref:HSP20-like chaperone n=1 Tax=Glomus cerebriforme TaxID=658196 RepID=A0A397TIC5_9GLOM|nr:HSP20-like chaperone [Glomus cerebriforme]